MDQFFKLAGDTFNKILKKDDDDNNDNNGGGFKFKLPPFVLEMIDGYLDDNIKRDLKPEIVRHIAQFQTEALDELEQRISDAFNHVVHLDDIKPMVTGEQPRGKPKSGEDDDDDLGDKFRNFFDKIGDSIKDEVMETLEEIFDPHESAAEYIPIFKQKITVILNSTHEGLAERFSDTVIDYMKETIRNKTSSKELPRELKEENYVEVQSRGLDEDTQSRGLDEGTQSRGLIDEEPQSRGLFDSKPGNPEKQSFFKFDKFDGKQVVQNLARSKLQSELTKVRSHSETFLASELQKMEAVLWSLLPEEIRGPLEFIMGTKKKNKLNEVSQKSRGLVVDGLNKIIENLQLKIQKVVKAALEQGHQILLGRAMKSIEGVVMGKVDGFLDNK